MLGIPLLVYIFAAVVAVGWVVLNRTTFGRRTFAIGGNPEAARLAGPATCAGTPSLLYVDVRALLRHRGDHDRVADHDGSCTHGTLYELDAIAAVIIGGTLLTGGRGTLIGSILGVLVFTTITNLFILNNLATEVQNIAKGADHRRRRAVPEPRPRADYLALHRLTLQTKEGDRCPIVPEPVRSSAAAASSLGALAVGAGAALGGVHEQHAAAPAAARAADAPPRARARRAGPAGDHRLLRARGRPRLDRRDRGNAQAQAAKYPDVTFEPVNPTNDITQQIAADRDADQPEGRRAGDPAQRRQPADLDRAPRRCRPGIPVINLDRIFDTPLAYRTWIGGDNYGMGVSAGNYIGDAAQAAKGVANPIIGEIAGIDSLPLTQERSQGLQGRAGDLRVLGRAAAGRGLHRAGRPARGREPAAGRARSWTRVWNHDDDQGIGVLAAIQQAGRSEFFMVGGAGSANAMRDIQADNTVLKATVTYSADDGGLRGDGAGPAGRAGPRA